MFSVRRLLREPLLHFLLLGAGLFAAFSWTSGDTATGPKSINVTQGTIEHLVEVFVRTRQRPPAEQEIKGLIQDYVREEISVREAMALGLDRDDLIIRRRLRQKLEFVTEDLTAQADPSNQELQTYLKEHPAEFATEPRYTFRQVYLDPQRHGENLHHDAARLLVELRKVGGKGNIAAIGDPSLLEGEFKDALAHEVRDAFGENFVAILGTLPLGQWQGPVESAYGAHVVFLTERTEGGVPPLESVRNAVRREWMNTKRREANDKFYEELLKRYDVRIEVPQKAQAK